MAKFGVKQSDFSKGLTITGSLVISGSQTITGSIISTFGFTGSLQGTADTASVAPNYTLTSTFVSASASFDDRITDNSSSIADLSSSFENLSSSFVDLNLTQIASGSYTASIGAYGFQVNTSASISGSLNVQGTITATTLVVQTITSSQELVTGSLIVSGALEAYGGITGSLFGTASYALNFPQPFQIVSGSVTASVSEDPSNLFLIKSGSFSYINIANNSNTTVNSNLFIIKNFTTQQPVLTVSQSLVSFATQSSDPTGTANNGAFWFTSTNLYVGLD